MKTVTYRLETMIPGVKSWGYLPEHEAMTVGAMRLQVKYLKAYSTVKIRVTKTVTTTRTTYIT